MIISSTTNYLTMLWILPREILKHEILPLLDDVSLYLLQVALHLKCPSADDLRILSTDRMQQQIVKLGPEIMEFFREHNLLQIYSVPKFAVMTGQLEVLKYIEHNRDYPHPLPEDSCEIAARHGHYHILSYLIHEKGHKVTDDVTTAAAINGSVAILEYLCKHYHSRDVGITVIAADHGHLDFLKTACELGFTCDKSTFDGAIAHGHVPCLEHLLNKYGVPDDICSGAAVLNGHVHMVKFLHERGLLRNNAGLCGIAVRGGSLAMLQYLYTIGYTKESSTYDRSITRAIGHGQIECLIYLHKQGVPVTLSMAEYAAHYHQLACLKYLVANGCPWDMVQCLQMATATCDPFQRPSNNATVKWIKEQIALSQPYVIA